MNERDLYTPQELMEKYPFLVNYGITATKIGVVFSMGCLEGRYIRRKAHIKLQSFLEFLEFRNTRNQIKIPKIE